MWNRLARASQRFSRSFFSSLRANHHEQGEERVHNGVHQCLHLLVAGVGPIDGVVISSHAAFLQLAGHHLCGTVPWTSDNGHIAQGHEQGEERVHNGVHQCLHLLVAGVGSIDGVVGELVALLMLQDEEVVLQADEVHILIINAMDVRHATGVQSSGSQILDFAARNGGQEVQVVHIVQSVREVLLNPVQILVGGQAKVYSRHIRNGVAIGVELPVRGIVFIKLDI